ncbi:hypothetical protein KIH07_06480 [Hydrogenophaga taeniospiralis]|uniref:HAD domain-containing protein n=1 Tax=Hydrogenophaga taeniospiralis TaxID=65656 RepID=UPI0021F556C7|nr:HAD domain-containing protein [Hydrogenophaga taeniospiralis]MCB4363372.1 hypothetical protein [Hydrogenophaga taeniospiralis]
MLLDFDGVTHPVPCGSALLFLSLPLIEAVLRHHPGVLVVLSTTWRITRPIEELREWFASDIESRVIGVTPVITLEERVWHGKFANAQMNCTSWLEKLTHKHLVFARATRGAEDRGKLAAPDACTA